MYSRRARVPAVRDFPECPASGARYAPGRPGHGKSRSWHTSRALPPAQEEREACRLSVPPACGPEHQSGKWPHPTGVLGSRQTSPPREPLRNQSGNLPFFPTNPGFCSFRFACKIPPHRIQRLHSPDHIRTATPGGRGGTPRLTEKSSSTYRGASRMGSGRCSP